MSTSADTQEQTTKIVNADPNAASDAGESPPKAVEVVLKEGTGSQPDVNAIVQRRVNKLNGRNDQMAAERDTARGDLSTAQQQNEMLQMQIDQLKAKAVTPEASPPDPLNFDDGAADPKYATALNEYTDSRVNSAVQRHLADQQPAPTTQNRHSEKTQSEHYQRAALLGVPDFDDVETAAMDILGTSSSKSIIGEFPNSELIMYYLGKNPGKAHEFRDLFDTNPVRGIRMLERLELQAEGGTQSTAPNPDTPLEGVTPASTNDLQKQLDKLRASAAETRNMDALMKFKREHPELVA